MNIILILGILSASGEVTLNWEEGFCSDIGDKTIVIHGMFVDTQNNSVSDPTEIKRFINFNCDLAVGNKCTISKFLIIRNNIYLSAHNPQSQNDWIITGAFKFDDRVIINMSNLRLIVWKNMAQFVYEGTTVRYQTKLICNSSKPKQKNIPTGDRPKL